MIQRRVVTAKEEERQRPIQWKVTDDSEARGNCEGGREAAADTMESYRRLRGAGSYSSKGRLLMRDGIFLLNRRELRHGKFWPIRRQMRIRYWWKVLMAQKEAAGLYKLAV